MFQTPRQSPAVPEVVAYYSLEDLRKTALPKLPSLWRILWDSSDCVKIGLVLGPTGGVDVTVTITELQATVEVCHMPAPGLSACLKNKKLLPFLKTLDCLKACEGVTSPDLQRFASPECSPSTSYFRQWKSYTKDGKLVQISTVRSAHCTLLISQGGICDHCMKVKPLLQQRHTKSHESVLELNQYHSLQGLTEGQLKEALKKLRAENKELRKELEFCSAQTSKTHCPDATLHVSPISEESPFVKLFGKNRRKRLLQRRGECVGTQC